MSTSRVCETCSTSKAGDHFRWNLQAGQPAVCSDCRRAAAAVYMRKRRQDKPETVRRSNLWRLYKIREPEYDALVAAQGNRCAACGVHADDIDTSKIGGRPKADGTRSPSFPLAVDHDHDTGRVRGLLCPGCNRGLGHFRDDPAALRGAADYLERDRP